MKKEKKIVKLHKHYQMWTSSLVGKQAYGLYSLYTSTFYRTHSNNAHIKKIVLLIKLSPTNLERELNQEITKVYSWLLSIKLMLNAAKSKFMIFFKVPKVPFFDIFIF